MVNFTHSLPQNNSLCFLLSKLEFTSHMYFIIKLHKEQKLSIAVPRCGRQLLTDKALSVPQTWLRTLDVRSDLGK